MNNRFKEVTSTKQMAEDLGITTEKVAELLKNALQYCNDKRVSHYTRGMVCGFDMITFLVRGKKTSNNLRQGYILTYTYNVDEPDLSELGEIYLLKSKADPKVFVRA